MRRLKTGGQLSAGVLEPIHTQLVIPSRPPRVGPVQARQPAPLPTVLRRLHPLNFHDGMEVSVSSFDFHFRIGSAASLELTLDNRRYQPRTRSPITLAFERVKLARGTNELHLSASGFPAARVFLIHHRFESAPYFGRRDPVTQETFALHHDIVRCRGCRQFSLRSSWSRAVGPCPFVELGSSVCDNQDGGSFGPSDLSFWERES